ncbi:MAG: chemotaxis protein CheD [Candidatus Hodarchaeota archaeon]
MKNIIAISHIMLPKCNGKAIYFPHKYANLSVEELLFEMIKEGSRNKDIRAIIIGGSTIFEIPMLSIGDQNIEIVKKELKSLGIKVEYEDTGGNIGRVINISAKSKKLLIRKAGKEIIRDLA